MRPRSSSGRHLSTDCRRAVRTADSTLSESPIGQTCLCATVATRQTVLPERNPQITATPTNAKTATDHRTSKRSARDRLLEAASELFYAEGIQSVGINRVIERANVAKDSLYSTFGSKEELIYAYLSMRHEETLARLRAAAASTEDPVEGLLAVFDAQARTFRERDFRGCAFTAAAAEAPLGGRIEAAAKSYRHDIHALFTELAAAAGAPKPALLASHLQIIYDGGALAANMDRNPGIATLTRAAASALLTATLAV
jgi:AcrR family transcriptional regulator